MDASKCMQILQQRLNSDNAGENLICECALSQKTLFDSVAGICGSCNFGEAPSGSETSTLNPLSLINSVIELQEQRVSVSDDILSMVMENNSLATYIAKVYKLYDDILRNLSNEDISSYPEYCKIITSKFSAISQHIIDIKVMQTCPFIPKSELISP